MARMKRGVGDEPPAGEFDETNAENYAARAAAFGKRKGYAPGEWPVIKPDQPAWGEWFAYFERIGHPFAKQNSFASRQLVMTVPARTPDDFEPAWRSREPTPFASETVHRYVKPLEQMSPEERALSRDRVAKILERVKREIAMSAVSAAARGVDRRHRMPAARDPSQEADDARFADLDAFARETIG